MPILNKKQQPTFARQNITRLALSGLVSLGTVFLIADSALAQGNGNVTVDLSVLDDNGMSPRRLSDAPPPQLQMRGGSLLMMPTANTPVSVFLGVPKSAAIAPQRPVTLIEPKPSDPEPVSAFTPPPAAPTTPTREMAAKPVDAEQPPAAPKLPTLAMADPKPEPVKAPVKAIDLTKIRIEPEEVKAPTALPKAPTAPPPPPAVKVPAVTKTAIPAPPPPAPKVSAPKVSAPKPAPVVEKVVKAAPKPPAIKKPAPQQMAKAMPKVVTKAVPSDGLLTVPFGESSSKLSDSGKAVLENLATNLKDGGDQRLQILAYAGGENLSPSRARRLSLSRALAIRSQLIDLGIRSTRIDVRALGSKVPSGDPNRVDLKIIER